ncbi:MAG TPA: hypothetical protein GX696_00115, partial [Pseudomonadaceae bacterium]|nr:hypothetical protein [Pseudomonadaceae bacterium]
TDVLADTALEVIPDSVAVLPFANLNPDGENTLFALGLHDEVINQLTKIRSLNVIARNSVLTLVDQELPLPEIRRLLRVESVMTGTILFADSQARINLQLLDPTSGVSFWAGTYEADIGNLDAMLEIQSDIALHVAEALEAEIRQSEQALITSRPTESFEAYRYNLAARNAHYQQDYAMEWSLVKQALELDPNYVDAWLLFASLNTVLVGTPLPGMSSRDHFELGLQSAERSIELAPDNSQGYALKAVALGTSKDWEGVAEAVDTLLNMDTPLSELKYVSLLLLCLGDFDRAIEIYEANLITEPLNLYGRGFLMAALEMAGRREDAQREYLIGEELNPVWWGDTVNVFLALGRDDALRDIDDLVGISAELKALLHRVDEPEAVRSAVFAYLDKPDKISAEALFYSALAAHIGELEVSVQLLRESLQDVWTGLHWYWLPLFDEARQLDSFKQLLNESGLVDYWNQHGWPKVCRPLEEGFSCDWTAY